MSVLDKPRIAARVDLLDADPLDFWDKGMLYALDIVEREIQDLVSRGKRITAESVLEILAKERKDIHREALHSFYLRSGPIEAELSPERNAKQSAPAENHVAQERTAQDRKEEFLMRAARAGQRR